MPTTDELARQVEAALSTRDVEAFGALLADDVRWGDEGHPRACRSKHDVLAVFTSGMAGGATADVATCVASAHAILCELCVRWPDGQGGSTTRRLWHVYYVRDDRIVEISSFDDRASAAAAAGVA